MKDYYEEVSYGVFSVGGTVYDWTPLSEPEGHQVGLENNGKPAYGLRYNGRTDQAIHEILTAMDPSVDFGQYDNYGDDGIPNSGDDEGCVDFAAFVHPEPGAECGTGPARSPRAITSGRTPASSTTGGRMPTWAPTRPS